MRPVGTPTDGRKEERQTRSYVPQSGSVGSTLTVPIPRVPVTQEGWGPHDYRQRCMGSEGPKPSSTSDSSSATDSPDPGTQGPPGF